MWAAAPWFRRLQGVEAPDQSRPFHMSRTHHVYVQERLLGDRSARVSGFCLGPVWIVQELESLILAQNERWRHA